MPSFTEALSSLSRQRLSDEGDVFTESDQHMIDYKVKRSDPVRSPVPQEFALYFCKE
jgi:hypothetical protein